MRRLGLGVLCTLLPLLLSAGGGEAGQGAQITFTVHVIGRTTRTALHLQPGFATVLRADHRVETVAIGDPRLVTATTVKRGPDVFDLVLQPQTATGTTNMIVWYGELTSVWDLTIGPAQRTADVVYVVTATPVVGQPTPGVLHAGSSLSPTSSPASSTAPTAPPHAAAPLRGGQDPAPPPSVSEDPYLEIQQTLPEAQAVFQLFRERTGMRIRYRITNTSTSAFAIRPGGVLVRANGRLIPFGMSRTSADKNRPAILPAGSTETGAIGAAAKTARQVELVFSLFPADEDRGATRTMPATFQILFSGLDRLATSSRL